VATPVTAVTEQKTEVSTIATVLPEIPSAITEPIQHRTNVLSSLTTHETNSALTGSEVDLIDAPVEDFLLADDEEFSAFLGRVSVATPSLPADRIGALFAANDEEWVAAAAVAEPINHAELQLLSTIKVNGNPVPPRFRAVAKSAVFRADGNSRDEETHALQQRQMDDLVFLSNQGRHFSVHPKYEGLFFPSGGLNMRLAGDFINEKAWSVEQKAGKLLRLTEYEQLLCSALVSKKVKDKWRNAKKHSAAIEEQLNAQAEKDHQFRQYVGDFTKLALADYLCKGWDAKTLPLVYGFLTQKAPISRQGIKAKLERLKKRLA
jgi:hypothetical protein